VFFTLLNIYNQVQHISQRHNKAFFYAESAIKPQSVNNCCMTCWFPSLAPIPYGTGKVTCLHFYKWLDMGREL